MFPESACVKPASSENDKKLKEFTHFFSPGIFTALVSGVYFFTNFCHSGGVRKTSLHLYKNNEVILHIHDHQSADTADNGGNAVFLQLQQGDTVYLRLKANTHVYRSSTLTNFSGFLVKKKQLKIDVHDFEIVFSCSVSCVCSNKTHLNHTYGGVYFTFVLVNDLMLVKILKDCLNVYKYKYKLTL